MYRTFQKNTLRPEVNDSGFVSSVLGLVRGMGFRFTRRSPGWWSRVPLSLV